MSEDTARVSAEVDPETKLLVELIAQRENKSEAQVLRDTLDERLAEEDIPDEVIAFFRQGEAGVNAALD